MSSVSPLYNDNVLPQHLQQQQQLTMQSMPPPPYPIAGATTTTLTTTAVTFVELENQIAANDQKAETWAQPHKKEEQQQGDSFKSSNASSDSDSKSDEEEKDGKKKKKKKKFKKKAKACLDKAIDMLDAFGESIDGPGIRKKTFVGAILTTIMRICVLILIAYKLYLLIIDNRTQTSGNVVALNYVKSSNVKYMDVPTLQMTIRKNITFYEGKEYGPSLQRIDINDNFGYEKPFSTRRLKSEVNDVVPVTKALQGKANLKLGSFESSITPPFTSVDVERAANFSQTLFTTEQKSLSLMSSRVSDPLKILYLLNGVYDSGDSQFYNHSVHLFLRFIDDMSHIKPCQIQIGLINGGILNLIQETGPDLKTYIKKEYQSHVDTYFATSNSTWQVPLTRYSGSGTTSEISSEGINYNLFYLTQEFNSDKLYNFLSKKSVNGVSLDVSKLFVQKGMKTSSFLEWAFLMSYVNNFVHTENTIQCDEYESEVRDVSSIYSSPPKNLKDWVFPYDVKILADLVNDTATTFYALVPSTFAPSSSKFSLIILGVTGLSEIVRVTSYEMPTSRNNAKVYCKFTVERKSPKDFKKLESQGNTFTDTVINYKSVSTPATLPPDWMAKGFWKCPPQKYGDGFCDCECGFVNATVTARDIDCNNLLPTLFSSSNFVNKYQNTSCAAKGKFCSSAGTCISAPNLRSSKPCYTKASYLGEKQVIGFFGSDSDFENAGGSSICTQCIGDTFYDEKAHLSYEHNKFICQASPVGYIFGRDFFSDILSSTGHIGNWTNPPENLSPKCVYVPVRVKVGHPEFPQIPDDGTYYDVSVGDNNSDQYVQTLYLTTVGTTKRTTKTLTPDGELVGQSQYDIQTLCLTNEDLQFKEMAGFGLIVSSVSPYSSVILVEARSLNTNDPSHALDFIGKFPSTGSFKVQFYAGSSYSDGIYDSYTKQPVMLDVQGVTELNSFQVLQLRAPPSFSIGLAFELKSFNNPARTNITVQQFPLGDDLSGTDIVKMVQLYKQDPVHVQRPKILIRPGVNEYSYVQHVEVDDLQVVSTLPLTYRLKLTTPVSPDFSENSLVECVLEMTIGTVLVPISLSSSYARKAFMPSESYAQGIPTPDSINVEYSMYIVPEKKKFPNVDYRDDEIQQSSQLPSTSLNLCPREYPYETQTILNNQDPVWTAFTINPTRGYQVQNCSLQVWTDSMVEKNCIHVSNSPKNQYNNNCIKEMPPTYSLTYNHVIQLNNKWQNFSSANAVDAATGGANRPEYEYNFKHVFFFQHDEYSNAVDAKFAGSSPSKGDTTQYNDKLFFNGKLNYIGKSKDPFLPANDPMLDMDATIDLSPFFVEDVLNNSQNLMVNYGIDLIEESGTWRLVQSPTRKNVEAFGKSIFRNLNIRWDFSTMEKGSPNNKLALTPGIQYNLQATLKITTVYSKGVFGNADITNVQVFVQSTSVSKSTLDYVNRNKCILNYVIQFDLAQSRQVVMASDYTFLAFFTDVGGALGIMAIGELLVELWQSYISQPEMFIKEAMEEDKERRRVQKKLKKKGFWARWLPMTDRNTIEVEDVVKAVTTIPMN
ncbi:hypothetical protein C9374_006012 [Naegleria lovaniensis]|uniref:Uncharacterized protein n=1 Tax=Naegleria lovaniensis TaxID=51637 RepID=A0AA88GP59_NAELO|nr:uncharacterized protein C9374_006012 [Naegleria lovaniensis]KAG2381628.1 hypothetical protein C9374_006012 [Naegleria lovaniensis]